MKIVHNDDWLKYTDDEGDYLELGLYLDKYNNLYHIGLDDFYHGSLSLEKLKLLSGFLVEYIKKEEEI